MRVYLDWNATAPLRPEARDAMIAAMDVVGNPSSVHGEGRLAKGVVERARAQVLDAFGASGCDLVFTSGATEAAALGLAGRDLMGAGVEHPCVGAWLGDVVSLSILGTLKPEGCALQAANSETGVMYSRQDLGFCDYVQAFGKVPVAFNWSGALMGALSSHKIGGPKGVGALVVQQGLDIAAQQKGGGQEMGRRAGTENVVGIAGFGAAAEASAKDLANGKWEAARQHRDALEARLMGEVPELIVFGKNEDRLPNTSCFGIAGWKGETQVMQMDLAGFAISAGSACSSGKVKASSVLQAMGYDDMTTASAVRVSIGPSTTANEIEAFGDAWLKAYSKFRAKAA